LKRNSYHKQRQSSIDDLGSSRDKNLLDSPTNTRAELNSNPNSSKSVRRNSNDKLGCNEKAGEDNDKKKNSSRSNSADSKDGKSSSKKDGKTKSRKNSVDSSRSNSSDSKDGKSSSKKDGKTKSRKNSVDSSSGKSKNNDSKGKSTKDSIKGDEQKSGKSDKKGKDGAEGPKENTNTGGSKTKQWIGRGLLVVLTGGSIYMIMAISLNSQSPEQWPWGFWYVFALLFDLGVFQPVISLAKFGLLLKFIKKPPASGTADFFTRTFIGNDILSIFSPKSGTSQSPKK
jgi:cobalamin biosynthesis Mg chelatase CobN